MDLLVLIWLILVIAALGFFALLALGFLLIGITGLDDPEGQIISRLLSEKIELNEPLTKRELNFLKAERKEQAKREAKYIYRKEVKAENV